MAKLPDVIKAVSPFASPDSAAVSKDGTIAYSSVSWNVNPNSLDTGYLDRLNQAVAPARDAGLQVAYGGGSGPDRPGDQATGIRRSSAWPARCYCCCSCSAR